MSTHIEKKEMPLKREWINSMMVCLADMNISVESLKIVENLTNMTQ